MLAWHSLMIWRMSVLFSLGFLLLVLILRYGLLPRADEYRPWIETELTQTIGQPVRIGRVEAGWHGVRPELNLSRLEVLDAQQRPVFQLQQVSISLSWWALFVGDIELNSFELDQPDLDIRRDTQGVLHVAGIALKSEGKGNGSFGEWLMRQDSIIIRDGRVSWTDEKLGAPKLSLQHAYFRLINDGDHHRFGLQAEGPPAVARRFDLRGDIVGDPAHPQDWEGALYAELDDADIAAWQIWMPPSRLMQQGISLEHGGGSLRTWVQLRQGKPVAVTADLLLQRLAIRLAADLPMLRTPYINGRLLWANYAGRQVFGLKQLAFATPQRAFAPTSIELALQAATPKKAEGGELRINALDIDGLVALAPHVPLPAEVRAEITQWQPGGRVSSVSGRWQGPWKTPTSYSLIAHFERLGFAAVRGNPGLASLSGQIEATESGGKILLNSPGLTIQAPLAMRYPVALEKFVAAAQWRKSGSEWEVELSRLQLANADLAAEARGRYRTQAGTPGSLDLTGKLSNVDARQVYRYMPLTVHQDTHDWLKIGLIAGKAPEAQFQVRGNLNDFPFKTPALGVFRVDVKIAGVGVKFAPAWPTIDQINGSLLFLGPRLEITGNDARTLGMALSKVKASIADLDHADILDVTGEGAGTTQQMFHYIENSPVTRAIDHFTADARADGNGRLTLQLKVPLHHADDTQVKGAYQFQSNRLVLGDNIPVLEKASGTLEFTERGITAQNLSSDIFGGPAVLAVTSGANGTVKITGRGKANITPIRNFYNFYPMHLLGKTRGMVDWRGQIIARTGAAGKSPEILIESNLLGLTSDLPYPFNKLATEPWPLRLELRPSGDRRETVNVALGNRLLNLALQRSLDTGQIESGAIVFGGAPANVPGTPGITLQGRLQSGDWDAWRPLLLGIPGGPGGSAASTGPGLNALNLHVGNLAAFSRRLRDVQLAMNLQGDVWTGQVASQEITGSLQWSMAGRGKVKARLKQLTMPQAVTHTLSGAPMPTNQDELPALDITAEQFEFKGKKLGRLELEADYRGKEWQVAKGLLETAEARMLVNGSWLDSTPSRTRLNLDIQIKDIGKFADRLGYTDALKDGKAQIKGDVSWAGMPGDIDLPSLSGKLSLDASSGTIAKADPGLARMLGVLSLQALPRRLILDFRDVFAEGFRFETITGNFTIDKGTARTNDLSVKGTAATINIKGESNLAQETQRLHVKVLPATSDSAALTTALLVNPAVGVLSYLLNTILNNPLSQIIAIDYDITGTWADPKIEKTSAAKPSSDGAQ